jgi:hypothetical protein
VETIVTGKLTFGADEVRNLVGWAKRHGQIEALVRRAEKGPRRPRARLTLVKGASIHLCCDDDGPRAFAAGCDPARDAYGAEVSEVLWGGPRCRISVDAEAVARLLAAAGAARLRVRVAHDHARAVLALGVEPEC